MSATSPVTAKDPLTIRVKVEFTGGLEALFSNKRAHIVQLPCPSPTNSDTSKNPTVAQLVTYLAEHALTAKSKRDLFVLDGNVRPGILVLINDADWELEGEGACELEDDDEVVFVSTLHGG